jgi:hypothetical protein
MTLLSYLFDTAEERQTMRAFVAVQHSIEELGVMASGVGHTNEPDLKHYKSLAWNCHTSQSLDVQKGRTLTLNLCETAANTLNQDERNAKLFSHFPLNVENVEITIHAASNPGDEVSWTYYLNGKIHYCLRDKERKIFPSIDVGYETYEEAKRVLISEKPLQREITKVTRGRAGFLEFSGDWGMFIEEELIKQIESGEFAYYFKNDGLREKLSVKEEKVWSPNLVVKPKLCGIFFLEGILKKQVFS